MADKITSETIFNLQDRVAPLDIIALPGTEELGGKINAHCRNGPATAEGSRIPF